MKFKAGDIYSYLGKKTGLHVTIAEATTKEVHYVTENGGGIFILSKPAFLQLYKYVETEVDTIESLQLKIEALKNTLVNCQPRDEYLTSIKDSVLAHFDISNRVQRRFKELDRENTELKNQISNTKTFFKNLMKD